MLEKSSTEIVGCVMFEAALFDAYSTVTPHYHTKVEFIQGGPILMVAVHLKSGSNQYFNITMNEVI